MALSAWLARGGKIDAPLLGPVAETWTPLMLACAEGDASLVRAIIETGGARASASVGTKVLISLSPLHIASRYGCASVAAILLEFGAVVEARDTIGLTPLHYASGNGHLATMEVLLGAGAETFTQSAGGATALDIAEMAGFDDGAALLKKRTLGGEAGVARRKAVGSWLEALGCEEFLARFLRAGYDDLSFIASQGLTEADLDCVGVPGEKLGLRKKLLAMHGVEQFLEAAGEEEEEPARNSDSCDTDEASKAKTNKSEGESGSDDNTGQEEEWSTEESSDSSESDTETSD